MLFGDKTFAQWQAAGQDKDSLIADPLFVDPEQGDFRLKPGSPAAKIGFEPWDLTASGRVHNPLRRIRVRRYPERHRGPVRTPRVGKHMVLERFFAATGTPANQSDTALKASHSTTTFARRNRSRAFDGEMHEPQNIQQGTAEFRRKEDRNRTVFASPFGVSLLDILRFIARALCHFP